MKTHHQMGPRVVQRNKVQARNQATGTCHFLDLPMVLLRQNFIFLFQLEDGAQ